MNREIPIGSGRDPDNSLPIIPINLAFDQSPYVHQIAEILVLKLFGTSTF